MTSEELIPIIKELETIRRKWDEIKAPDVEMKSEVRQYKRWMSSNLRLLSFCRDLLHSPDREVPQVQRFVEDCVDSARKTFLFASRWKKTVLIPDEMRKE